jgi:hypothetical protein
MYCVHMLQNKLMMQDSVVVNRSEYQTSNNETWDGNENLLKKIYTNRTELL